MLTKKKETLATKLRYHHIITVPHAESTILTYLKKDLLCNHGYSSVMISFLETFGEKKDIYLLSLGNPPRTIIRALNLLKMPLTPEFFFIKVNHCTCWKRIFFPFSNKSCHFISFKSCKQPSIFCSRPSQKLKGVGLFLI